jgi:hypothetical protein
MMADPRHFMTVRRLIAALKKMPSDAIVGVRNHDQSEDELDGLVRAVEPATPEMTETHHCGVVLQL